MEDLVRVVAAAGDARPPMRIAATRIAATRIAATRRRAAASIAPACAALFAAAGIAPACVALFAVAFLSCSPPPVQRGMYWWRTVFAPSPYEEAALRAARVTTLYIRFFDVVHGEGGAGPAPVAQVDFRFRPDPAYRIVPVVYITVHALRGLSADSAALLGRALLAETDRIAAENGIRFSEFQVDCDWTPSVRDAFFRLAATLRDTLHARGASLSATVRLHQYRWPGRTGVPPADRAMLMDYNMGRMSADPADNSIYREADAKPYIEHAGRYPLPLDAVLPLFFWTLQFRGGSAAGILGKTAEADFRGVDGIEPAGDGLFTVQRPSRFRGSFLAKGDVLKPESVSASQCLAAGRLLARRLPSAQRTIALFECDSLYLIRYAHHDLNELYSAFQ